MFVARDGECDGECDWGLLLNEVFVVEFEQGEWQPPPVQNQIQKIRRNHLANRCQIRKIGLPHQHYPHCQ